MDSETPTTSEQAAKSTFTLPFKWWWIPAVLVALCLVSLQLSWRAQQRASLLEQELVRRQQASMAQVLEAQTQAKLAQDVTRDMAAKVALLEAKVAEAAGQRGQLEELLQSLSRSRDENLLSDIEANLRVGQQQAVLTGSVEPLVLSLRQADERLARVKQPRLDGVRRAIARDLDRARSASATDLPSLSVKLDEVIGQVDDLPMLSSALDQHGKQARDTGVPTPPASASGARRPPAAASAAPASDGTVAVWRQWLAEQSASVGDHVWQEARKLVRVTRIERPEAALLAPDQAFFLKENLKLRLLNARLGLLSRQFETARSDMRLAEITIERYYDKKQRRTQLALDQLRLVYAQTAKLTIPRPDDTLAALAALGVGR